CGFSVRQRQARRTTRHRHNPSARTEWVRVELSDAAPSLGRRQGGGSGSALAELNACTPASLSPSNGVTGLTSPRQTSSSSGSANQHATRRRSTRTRLPLTSVDEKASVTIRLNVFWPFPRASVLKSPMYSAAPNGDGACSSRNTVKSRLGGSWRAL